MARYLNAVMWVWTDILCRIRTLPVSAHRYAWRGHRFSAASEEIPHVRSGFAIFLSRRTAEGLRSLKTDGEADHGEASSGTERRRQGRSRQDDGRSHLARLLYRQPSAGARLRHRGPQG